MSVVQEEPIAAVGTAVLGVVSAGIALLPLFGADVSIEQQGGLIAFATSIIGTVTLIARLFVTPVSKANTAIENAWTSDPRTDEKPTLANPSPK